ncbi:MAG: ComF family protein [bacterium]
MISFTGIMRSTNHAVREFGALWLDYLYPPVCRSCAGLLTRGEHQVCATCWANIPRISSDHLLFQDTNEKLLSSRCIHGLVSVFVFEKESAFQHIVHALKYDGVRSLGVALGKQIGLALLDARITADYVLAVPLHRRKYRERGYNQSDSLAEGITSITGIVQLRTLICRSKDTQSQTTLNLEQRKKNVHEAFSLKSNRVNSVEGKSFIIVDDVITTGATIEACAKILLACGAQKIIAASAALAQKDTNI